MPDETPRRAQYALPKYTCSWCREIKEPGEFFTKKNARGLDGVCKVCRALEAGDEGPLDDDAVRRFCTRKGRYGSEAFANEVAMRALRIGKVAGLRSYPCPACGGWHVTTRTDIGSAPRSKQTLSTTASAPTPGASDAPNDDARRRAERRARRRAAKAGGAD